MANICRSIGCTNYIHSPMEDFCEECRSINIRNQGLTPSKEDHLNEPTTMAQKYPKYYKPVGNLTEVDVYAIHKIFNVQDPSGAIHHASKKLLLSGVRTGGKTAYKDIQEARDTLTRWLQLNDDTQ